MIINREAFVRENAAEVFLTHTFANYFQGFENLWMFLENDFPEHFLFWDVEDRADGWFVVTEEEVIIEAVWL